jgi:hypothetical protein
MAHKTKSCSAECRKQAHYAECHYAQCRYLQCRSASEKPFIKKVITSLKPRVLRKRKKW